MKRQSVSKHLAILESAHLVTTARHGREKHHYLNAAPINAIADRSIGRFDRHRAEALADLKNALEQQTMDTTTETTVGANTFVYETYIRTKPEQLWRALTDPAFTQRYWGVELTSDWRVGSPITWHVAGATIEDPEQRVLVADKPRLLSFTWHAITPEFAAAIEADPDEIAAMAAEPRSHVTFEIEPRGEVVGLKVTHSGFEPGSAVLAGVSGGWPEVLASLKTMLETGDPLDWP